MLLYQLQISLLQYPIKNTEFGNCQVKYNSYEPADMSLTVFVAEVFSYTARTTRSSGNFITYEMLYYVIWIMSFIYHKVLRKVAQNK